MFDMFWYFYIFIFTRLRLSPFSLSQVRLGALSTPPPPVNLATCYRKSKNGGGRVMRRPSLAEKFVSGAAAVFSSTTTPSPVPSTVPTHIAPSVRNSAPAVDPTQGSIYTCPLCSLLHLHPVIISHNIYFSLFMSIHSLLSQSLDPTASPSADCHRDSTYKRLNRWLQ